MLAVAILSVAGAIAAATLWQGADEAPFSYMGYAWFHGGDLPYRDAFDNKPPGIYLLWGLVWRYAHGSGCVARLAGVGAGCLSALVLASVGAKLSCRLSGIWAASAFLTVACSTLVCWPFADTETFGVLLSLGALSSAWPQADRPPRLPRIALAGLLSGGAIMFKQTFVIELLIVLWLTTKSAPCRHPVMRGSALIAGASVPLVLTTLYFARHGAATHFLQWVLIGPAEAERTLVPPDLTLLGVPVPGIVARFVVGLAGSGRFLANPMPFALVLLSAVALRDSRKRGLKTTAGLAAWGSLVLCVIVSQGRAYDHQFKQLLAPLCLLASAYFVPVGTTHAKCATRRLVRHLIVAAAVATLALNWGQILETHLLAQAPHNGRDIQAAGTAERVFASPEEAVTALTQPTGRIWCYYAWIPSVYVDARRLSASPHYHPLFLSDGRAQADLLACLRAGRAQLVLVDWSFLPAGRPHFHQALRRLLEERFTRCGTAQRWAVYSFAAGEPPSTTLGRALR